VQKIPLGGIGLLGGAEESHEGMRWFLERAQGGDVVVLRASGADGYHDYFYKELGVNIHSVETFVCRHRNASYDPYLLKRLNEAEAVWIAGGDQWNYYSFWKNTPLDTALQQLIDVKHIAIGGTSAGMAILAGIIFTAEKGTTTSAIALRNPFDTTVCLSPSPLLSIPYLHAVITDTHYDARERNGRHMAFLARAVQNAGNPVLGIACEESTMVCISPDGKARVFGQYPQQAHYAYFLQSGMQAQPEQCLQDQALTWWNQGQAVYTYRIPGTPGGTHSLDLNNWTSGKGGRWEKWAVQQGKLVRDTSATAAPFWHNHFIKDPPAWFRISHDLKNNRVIHWESQEAVVLQIRAVESNTLKHQVSLHGKSGTISLPRLPSGQYQLVMGNAAALTIGSFRVHRGKKAWVWQE
jgi:cyanophycinase-like exopeptidase